MPVSIGSGRRSCVKASRPPAEAPIPTTRNDLLNKGNSRACLESGRVDGRFFGACDFMIFPVFAAKCKGDHRGRLYSRLKYGAQGKAARRPAVLKRST